MLEDTGLAWFIRTSSHESTLGFEVYRFFWKVSSVEMC